MSDCAVNQMVRAHKHRAGGIVAHQAVKGEIKEKECPEKERKDILA